MKKTLIFISFLLVGSLFSKEYRKVLTPKGRKSKIRVVTEFKRIKLVDIKDYIPDAIVNLKYYRRYSLFRKKIYRKNICLVKRKLARKLKLVDKILRKKYKKRLKFLDCYRPWSVQAKKWRYFPNKKYVDHPYYGSKHNKGAAIDVTLVNLKGKKVRMPTRYDHFSKKAGLYYKKTNKKAKKNRAILRKVMRRVRLVPSKRKWWHYSLKYTRRYPILDITLKDYVKEKKEYDKNMMFKNNKRKNREVSNFSFNKKNKNRDIDSEIKKGISVKKKDIVSCFIKEFNRGVNLPEKLVISYVIRQNGKIYDVVIQHKKYKNKKDELNYCVLKVFNSIKFNRFPRSTIGQMPLEFSLE